jgi:hypothetical protein
VVLVAKKAIKAAGGDVALMNLQPQIRKVFDIIQALPSLSVFESVPSWTATSRASRKGQGGRRAYGLRIPYLLLLFSCS